MKRKIERIALGMLFITAVYAFRAAHGQQHGHAVLVDSMGAVNCELLLSRLDSFAAEVHTTPRSVGFAVLYPGDNPFVNAAYERGIKNNSAFRNFPAHLVQPIWAKGDGTFKIEMWKVTSGTELPSIRVAPTYDIPKLSRRTRFVEGDAEVITIDGKFHFITGSDNCVAEFNLTVLPKVLSANPGLSAEIVIFNRSRRSAGRLTRLIRNERAENNIPTDRLKIIYGGSGVAKEWSPEISAVEIWLLPNKRK